MTNSDNRKPLHEYFMEMAECVSQRSSCPRRSVGCIIINEHHHIKATGYNGVPRNMEHCTPETPCGGQCGESGKDLDSCHAVHAEQNALLQCENVMAIKTIYCTTSPCMTCAKLIANTSCKMLVYKDAYADDRGLEFLRQRGIVVLQC